MGASGPLLHVSRARPLTLGLHARVTPRRSGTSGDASGFGATSREPHFATPSDLSRLSSPSRRLATVHRCLPYPRRLTGQVALSDVARNRVRPRFTLNLCDGPRLSLVIREVVVRCRPCPEWLPKPSAWFVSARSVDDLDAFYCCLIAATGAAAGLDPAMMGVAATRTAAGHILAGFDVAVRDVAFRVRPQQRPDQRDREVGSVTRSIAGFSARCCRCAGARRRASALSPLTARTAGHARPHAMSITSSSARDPREPSGRRGPPRTFYG